MNRGPVPRFQAVSLRRRRRRTGSRLAHGVAETPRAPHTGRPLVDQDHLWSLRAPDARQTRTRPQDCWTPTWRA